MLILFEMTRTLGFLEESRPRKNNSNKMSSDVGSVPDPKHNDEWRGKVCKFILGNGVASLA